MNCFYIYILFIKELMEIMTYMPFVGSRIYDGELIEKACYAISEVARNEEDTSARGLCLAVRTSFLPDITRSDQEAVLQAVSCTCHHKTAILT
jgi:hypothetical protein